MYIINTLKKASEILQSSIPKNIEMDVKEKEENDLLKNDVKQQTEEMGLSEKVFKEKQNEDYNQSVVISTDSTKIVISYK